jgi:vanillate O-demethylase monooxygenase subunit
MGDQDLADPDLIPDLDVFDKPALARSHGYLHVRANYQLIVDNLLDLTHAEFLHPFLVPEGAAERTRLDVRQEGQSVWSMMWIDRQPITPLFNLVWDNDETVVQFRSHTMWTAPSAIGIDTGMAKEGENDADWPTLPSFHLLTPETETSAHYFWMIGRNRRIEDEELGQNIHNAIHQAFTTEDEPMIARAQENMGEADFWELEPSILSSDKAAIRARRITQKLIREEGKTILVDKI